ncbi:MAG: hypothetical protein PHV11_10420 [Candidatus Bipolaricaulis sp.]|nr:hypothetical protein [Candidatus Bipolaricaulis sp.]
MTYLNKYISSADTYRLSEKSEGVLHSITVGETAAGTITVSDIKGTIAVLKASVAEGTYLYDITWNGFLEIVTAGASKISVSYY